jgi:hypothetical protein
MLLWPTSDIPLFQPKSPVGKEVRSGGRLGANTSCSITEYIVIP